MRHEALDVVILGLSITSSWGNGHATTYRGLVRELAARGHRITFLERDQPWYADNRDDPEPSYCRTGLYGSLEELKDRFEPAVRRADLVLVGSYVPDGVAVGDWVTRAANGVTSFYDIDTPVTLAKLARGDYEYLAPELIPRYNAYFSFTGGPTLQRLERQFGSPMARPLYCSFDPDLYQPEEAGHRWDLGYMGTYSDDRQPTVERLLLEPARRWPEGRFAVAGPQYPKEIRWPKNVKRFNHLEPKKHARFYNQQRFTLNVTRADMIAAGWSPSVRLFEAAACATPIISDEWPGLGSFFKIGEEILTARNPGTVLQDLRDVPEPERRALGERARARVSREHTAAHRAEELEGYALSLLARGKAA